MTTVVNFEDYVDHEPGTHRSEGINDPSTDEKNLTTKRLRIQHSNLDEFQPGAVIKLKLTNFVTYALTEFHLSPSLNMIIGPNGSGKSTFVCAICLGLGGKPEYIGRSKKVEEYIKNGTEEGSIEITLRNSKALEHSDFDMINQNDEVVHVKRVLALEKRRSKYFINNRLATEDIVRRMVQKLNIQLDNLCQFLSQERVEEFARLKPDTLLCETIRSIEAGLLQKLSQLKSLQAESSEQQKELDNNETKLTELSSKRGDLETQVDALERYEEKARELDIHQKLLNYAYLKEHREQHQALKNKRKTLLKEIKVMQKEMTPYNDLGVQLSKDERSCKSEIEDLSRKRYSSKSAFNKCTEELQNTSKHLSECKSKVTFLTTRNKTLKEDIKLNEERIKSVKQEKEKVVLGDPEDIRRVDENLRAISTKRDSLREEIAGLESKRLEIPNRISTKTRDLNEKRRLLSSNVNLNLLDKLAGRNNTVFAKLKNAILYVRSNEETKGKIFEPPILSISANDAIYAAYLHSCVDFHTSTALTMINRHAYDTFSTELVHKFNVNIRELSNQPIEPPMSREELRRFGFEGYLIDFIKGDENVLKMLCQQQKIHMIPVTKRPLSVRDLELLKKADKNGRIMFPKFIEGSHIHNISRSDYGKRQIYSKSASIRMSTEFYKGSAMGAADIESINLSIKHHARELSKLEVDLATIIEEMKNKDIELTDLRHVKDNLKTQRDELDSGTRLLKQYDLKILRYQRRIDDNNEKLTVDLRESINVAKNKLQEAHEKERKALLRLYPITKQLQEHDIELATKNIKLLDISTKIDSISQICKSMEQECNLKKEEFSDVSQEYENTKDTEELKRSTNEIKSYTEEEKDILNDIAMNYNEENRFNPDYIQSVIDRLSSELSMIDNNTSVIDILKQTKASILSLEKIIPLQRAKIVSIKQNILEIKNELEPRLDQIVTQISEKFSDLFRYVGSAGQVELVKPDSFVDWCIRIKVKFRDNSELQQLNPHVQSGGERAVSTVLYMIALQQFTSSPFRVVDEINQGMDQTNERIVHRIMVENACAEHTSQYFLITPKLLSNLFYHDRMRIHCVFAGSWIPNPETDPERAHFGEATSYIL
ncbi:unnamed protein product [Kluyveromyces dobzhanskii CBS 2104]|uniref:Structural maintenance of chromosomes protein 5 n=1 Tax=Kluyveromyces dobzhanskii CBS 2104 TaxID=1427455 RepID=A0A0A8L9X4_9SACH|nr:unnamed protein product [Kluyveromyces dobzhanskii CBS 2104]